MMQSVLRAHPDRWFLWCEIGHVLQRTAGQHDATLMVAEALRRWPGCYWAWNSVAHILWRGASSDPSTLRARGPLAVHCFRIAERRAAAHQDISAGLCAGDRALLEADLAQAGQR